MAQEKSSVDTLFVFHAQRSIEKGESEEALKNLSHVAVSERNHQVVSLGLQALHDVVQKIDRRELDEQGSFILKSAPVQDFIAYLEAQGGERSEYETLYKHGAMFCADIKEIPCVRAYYQKISSLVLGEQLIPFKKSLALAVVGAADKNFAQELVREIEKEGEMTFFFKAKLFLFGFYGFWQLLLIGLLCIVCASFVLFLAATRINSSFVLPQNKQKPSVKGYLRKIDEDEYSTLLASLNLGDGATEDDIKNRYRELAKMYHPDSGAPLDENIEKFRELKKTYERILEFKKRSFSGR